MYRQLPQCPSYGRRHEEALSGTYYKCRDPYHWVFTLMTFFLEWKTMSSIYVILVFKFQNKGRMGRSFWHLLHTCLVQSTCSRFSYSDFSSETFLLFFLLHLQRNEFDIYKIQLRLRAHHTDTQMTLTRKQVCHSRQGRKSYLNFPYLYSRSVYQTEEVRMLQTASRCSFPYHLLKP